MDSVRHNFHISVQRTGLNPAAYATTGCVELSCGSCKEGTFFLDLTQLSAGTFDAKIQTYDPLSAKWFDLVAFTQLNAAGSEKKVVIDNLGDTLQLTYKIGTTAATATFSVSGILKG